MDNKTQRFKISLPIIKTYVEIHKDKDGNEKEVRFVEGLASGTEKDLHGDRMAPSAIQSMADSLKLHVINLNDEHNTSWQSELGELVKLEVTKKDDLRIKARLNEMSKSNDLWYALTDLNKKLGLSIGGYVKEYEMEKDESGDKPTWVRVYKDIELDHIAVTSRPAYPKAWVSVISKSIETSEENLKQVKKRVPAKLNKEQKLKELAHQIVRNIQNMEADLLLELTFTGLSYLNEDQLKLVERNLPMDTKKDVSLEAEEAKKKADADVKPEDEKDEASAAPENESSDDESKVEDDSKEEAKDDKDTDADKSDEAKDESAEKSEDDDAKAEDDKASDDEDEADAEDSDTEKDESEDDSGKEEATDESEEDAEDADSEGSDEDKSDEGKSKDKSDKAEDGQLLKTVHELSKSLKKMVKANEALVGRIEDIESQPADRKTIEVKKAIGDDDSEEVDAKALKKERDEKIAELKKTHANDPALFSMIQKTRAEYASKIQQS